MLGPVEVVRDGAVVALTRQERVFIAALASRAPEPVSFGLLEDALWRDGAPRRPDKALQSLVLRMRRTLGADAIETRATGYALAPSIEVDAAAFARSVDENDVTGLTTGLAMWRGSAYEDLDAWEPAQHEALRLDELRRHAAERLATARLVEGSSPALIAELQGLVAAEPLRERRRELLVEALTSGGRDGEALAEILRARETMHLEVGTDIGPALSRLEHELRARQQRPAEAISALHRRARLALEGGDGATAAELLRTCITRGDAAELDLRTRTDLLLDLGRAGAMARDTAGALDAFEPGCCDRV